MTEEELVRLAELFQQKRNGTDDRLMKRMKTVQAIVYVGLAIIGGIVTVTLFLTTTFADKESISELKQAIRGNTAKIEAVKDDVTHRIDGVREEVYDLRLDLAVEGRKLPRDEQ